MATERRLARLAERIDTLHQQLAGHEQSDYTGLAQLTDELRGVEAEQGALEERWFELSELLD